MGLMDRDYMHERQRNQATPNSDPRPSLKKLKIQRSYPKLLSVLLYLLAACLPVILYLQTPIPVNKPNATLVSNKLNCAIGEIKWDANKDGVFTIADVRPLTLNIFSLPARYVNSNNSLTKIVDLFEIKGACNGRMAAVFNGCAWLIGYVLLAGLLILIWNLTKLLLQLLLFRGLNLSRSKKLVNNIYWGLYPQWNFAMDFIFPIILCGGVTIISLISLDSFAKVSSQQQPRASSNSPQNQPVVVPSATKPLSGLAPAAQSNIATRLETIKDLLNRGLISQVEYDAKKKEILGSF